ncbi:DUF58 domain-containing protein [Candidatus Woesearchaeota archaeon]|nr:DUF58 domain-containing protein [Candidatus Woesearchaeota archaeon]
MAIDTKFLKLLSRFSLIIKKRVTSNYSGSRRSIAFGHGLTIKDYRDYVRGDDLRLLDWKIYARTNKLYIRQFEEDKTLTVHIILDYSASMNYGDKLSKFDYGAMIGTGFSYLALSENDKFAFNTFSSDLNAIKPRRGISQMASIVDKINSLQVKGISRFDESMTKYRKNVKGRSLIVVISDFLFDQEEIKSGLLRLGKHQIHVIQVLGRAEKELKLEGDLKLYDSESKQVLRTFVSRRMREKYQEKLNNHSAAINEICTTMNASFHQVTTDEDIFDVFYKILRH